MLTLAINIIYPFITLLVLLVPVINFTFFVKPNKKILIIYSTILYIFISYWYNSPNIIFAILIFLFFYLFIIYKEVLIAIVLSGTIWILMFISDAITGALLINILKYNYSDIKSNRILDFISELLILLIIFILSKFIRLLVLNIFNRIDVKFEMPKKSHISFLFIILLIIFVIYQTGLQDFVQTWDDSMVLFNALNLFSFFVFIVAMIYYSFTILINKHRSNEYLQLKNYTNLIENMHSDLRSFRHDYFNILSTLEIYIQKQDIDGLKNFYYNDLLPESNTIMNKDTSLSYLSHIKISPLKALISSKIINAHSQSIYVKIEIADDIEEINMSIIDICRIIGILLDNAIEGVILCDHKFIYFAMIKTDNEIIFNITNSCLSSTPPIHELYKRNFSTKGSNRGIGLNNIKDIINKRYKNVLLNTTINNCTFTQELIIHKK